jgi:hypothetical protein
MGCYDSAGHDAQHMCNEFTFTLHNMCGQRHDLDRVFLAREDYREGSARTAQAKENLWNLLDEDLAKMASPECEYVEMA